MKLPSQKNLLNRDRIPSAFTSFSSNYASTSRTTRSGKKLTAERLCYESSDEQDNMKYSPQINIASSEINPLELNIIKTKQISKELKSQKLRINKNPVVIKQLQMMEEQDENFHTSKQIFRKRKQNLFFRKVFYSEDFTKVPEIDFQVYINMMSRNKLYSTLLLNENGQIIFADRLGSEHYEGSLNNFNRNPVQSMLLGCRLKDFLMKASNVSKQNNEIIKLILYSKNSKRRYSKITSKTLSQEDIFNRYLKTLTTKITPIQIQFASYQQYQGYWNDNLLKVNQPLQCYLLRTRLSKRLPDINQLNLLNDDKILKFLEYTKKKQSKRSKMIDQNEMQVEQEEESQMNTPIRSHKNMTESEVIEIDPIILAANNDIKYSKSALTRMANSSQGKKQNIFRF